MSSFKYTITIQPTVLNNYTETLKVPPFECPACHGRGSLHLDKFDPDYLLDDEQSRPCVRCAGSGFLEAEITVAWRPSKHDK